MPLLAAENERQGTETQFGCWIYCHITPGRTLSGDEVDAHFAGYYFADDPHMPREVAVAGSAEQCAAKVREYFDAGVDRLILDFANHGIDPVASSLEQMSIFREVVVPRLDSH